MGLSLRIKGIGAADTDLKLRGTNSGAKLRKKFLGIPLNFLLCPANASK